MPGVVAAAGAFRTIGQFSGASPIKAAMDYHKIIGNICIVGLGVYFIFQKSPTWGLQIPGFGPFPRPIAVVVGILTIVFGLVYLMDALMGP